MTERPSGMCVVCGSRLLLEVWRGHPDNRHIHCNYCGSEVTPFWHDRHQASVCITRIGECKGKAFVVYLRDGTKITVGRDKTTKGPAWLEVGDQAKITIHERVAKR